MNISEIARLAGVSSATVSRYFNHGYISEAKREVIRKVVEETGFRPLMQAQTLRTKKTMMVGVVAPKMASYSIGQVVDGILRVLNESDYQMLLAVTQNDPDKELAYLKSFSQRGVDGIIYIASGFSKKHLQLLKRIQVPLIIVGQQLDGYNCVYHDDYHAIYDMTAHVCASGRKKAAWIGVSHFDPAAGLLREQAYIDALLAAGRGADSKYMATSSFSVGGGTEKAKELLDRCPDIDAMICATDEIAAGAFLYLASNGRKVPEDIMVTGLGDSDLSRAAGHGICTIRFEYRMSGETAARLLLERMQNTGEGQGEQGSLDGPAEKEKIRQVRLGYRMILPSGD